MKTYFLVINPVGAPVEAILDRNVKYLLSYTKERREKDAKAGRRLPTNYYIFELTKDSLVK
jgi:hypothetical protein